MTVQDRKQFPGRVLKVYFNDGSEPIVGKYYGYTQAFDNDPEVASLEIKVRESDDFMYSLDEDHIDHIEFADEQDGV